MAPAEPRQGGAATPGPATGTRRNSAAHRGGERPLATMGYVDAMTSTIRAVGATGATLAASAVAAGAFGAHTLRSHLDPRALEIFATGAHYHLLHAVGVLVLAALAAASGGATNRTRGLVRAAWLLVGGVVVFSGSLYVLAISGVRGLGAVTPIGGVAMIAGWLTAAWSLLISNSGEPEP